MIGGRERRQPDESVHAFQHRLITDRTRAWRTSPRRTGADKVVRRERNKRAWWTLRGHLVAEHRCRQLHFATYDDAMHLHTQLHTSTTKEEA